MNNVYREPADAVPHDNRNDIHQLTVEEAAMIYAEALKQQMAADAESQRAQTAASTASTRTSEAKKALDLAIRVELNKGASNV
jgi:hypothetical protein